MKLSENDLKHIAIIMDGNRRWAKERNMLPELGHKAGAETLKKIAKYANEIGLQYLSVYAFSTENWKRSKEEVEALMTIFQNYLDDFINRIDTKNIRVKILGDMSALSERLQTSMNKAMEKTKNNTGLTLCLCINYGGRHEIVTATKKIAEKVKAGELKVEDIDESVFSDNLYSAGIPDPDLLIRTSKEYRTSNFLPWQIVYSEFLFIPKYWPDFCENDLDEAIKEYNGRNRKFGGK